MKTILYLSAFQQSDSQAYQSAVDITPDEVVVWDGDNTVIQHDISSFPCLVIDPEGAEKEEIRIDPETEEEITVTVPMMPERFEHRKGETAISARLAELQSAAV